MGIVDDVNDSAAEMKAAIAMFLRTWFAMWFGVVFVALALFGPRASSYIVALGIPAFGLTVTWIRYRAAQTIDPEEELRQRRNYDDGYGSRSEPRRPYTSAYRPDPLPSRNPAASRPYGYNRAPTTSYGTQRTTTTSYSSTRNAAPSYASAYDEQPIGRSGATSAYGGRTTPYSSRSPAYESPVARRAVGQPREDSPIPAYGGSSYGAPARGPGGYGGSAAPSNFHMRSLQTTARC
jgi:hypothetical protein